MAPKKPRISIPNSFFIWRISIFFSWRISIPNSFLVWRISIPNQFQKDLGDTAVKTVGFSWGCTKGGAQGAHSTKGHTREPTVGAQWAHREPHSARFSQLFCFSSWRDEIRWADLVAHGRLKFSVAHGHFKFPVAHSHFKKKIWVFLLNIHVRGNGYCRKMKFDIILKLHVPGSTEIGQKWSLWFFWKFICPGH